MGSANINDRSQKVATLLLTTSIVADIVVG